MEARIVGERDGVPLYRKVVFSDVYTIDRIYKSMMGPHSRHTITLLDGEPEIVWLVGYRAAMTEPDGKAEISADFMCHSNLDMKISDYLDHFPTSITLGSGRLFTLAQGQLSVKLPEGFGVPMMSNLNAIITSQVLNHNEPSANFDLRQRIEIDFVRNRDLEKPLTPLAASYANELVLISGPDGYYGFEPGAADPEKHGPGCSIGEGVMGVGHTTLDGNGRTFTGFWVLPPGRVEHSTRVTEMMKLPYDTKVHHITSHLHPFAETLELRDRTTGETVYKTEVEQASGKIGVVNIDQHSSVEGIQLYKGHEYELIGTYNNTTSVNQDAMASMMLFVRARDMSDFYFRKDR